MSNVTLTTRPPTILDTRQTRAIPSQMLRIAPHRHSTINRVRIKTATQRASARRPSRNLPLHVLSMTVQHGELHIHPERELAAITANRAVPHRLQEPLDDAPSLGDSDLALNSSGEPNSGICVHGRDDTPTADALPRAARPPSGLQPAPHEGVVLGGQPEVS